MNLDNKIIKQFTDLLSKDETKKNSQCYGTIETDGTTYRVRIDGSDRSIEIVNDSSFVDGERVSVNVSDKNLVEVNSLTTKDTKDKIITAANTVGTTDVSRSDITEIVNDVLSNFSPNVDNVTHAEESDTAKKIAVKITTNNGESYTAQGNITAEYNSSTNEIELKNSAQSVKPIRVNKSDSADSATTATRSDYMGVKTVANGDTNYTTQGTLVAEHNQTTDEIELKNSAQHAKTVKVAKATRADSATTSTRSDYMGVKTVANGSTNYTTQGTLVAEHNQTTDEIELKNSAEHAKSVRVNKADSADSATTATRSDYMGVKIATNNGTSYTAQGTLIAEYNSSTDEVQLKNSASSVKPVRVDKATVALTSTDSTNSKNMFVKTSTNNGVSYSSQGVIQAEYDSSVDRIKLKNSAQHAKDVEVEYSTYAVTATDAINSRNMAVKSNTNNGVSYSAQGVIVAELNSSTNEIELKNSAQSVKPLRVSKSDTADSATTATRSDYMGVKTVANGSTNYTTQGTLVAEYNSTTDEVELKNSAQHAKTVKVGKATRADSATTATRSDYMGVKTVANGDTNYTTQGTLVAEHNQTTDEIELKNSAEHAKSVRVSKSDTADSATTATRSDYMGVKIATNNGTSYTAQGTIVGEYNSETDEIDLKNSAQNAKTIRVGKATYAVNAASAPWSGITNKPTIPSKTSQLTNDSNFLTSASTIPWSRITSAPTIPTKTTQLTNDSGFLTSVSWDNVTNRPTKLSQFTNDLSLAGLNAASCDLSKWLTVYNGNEYGTMGSIKASYNSSANEINLAHSGQSVKPIRVNKADSADSATTSTRSDYMGVKTVANGSTNYTTQGALVAEHNQTTDEIELKNSAEHAKSVRVNKADSADNAATSTRSDYMGVKTVANGSTNYTTQGTLVAEHNQTTDEIELKNSAEHAKPVRVSKSDTADSATTATRSDYMGVKIDTNNGTSYTAQGTLVAEYNSESDIIELKNSATNVKTIKVGKADYAVNAASVPWSGVTGKPTIPTKTTQLTNDSGFLTTSSTIPWSRITSAPTIPTKTSQLTNDSGFLTSVSWDNVTNRPTKLSQFINDISLDGGNASSCDLSKWLGVYNGSSYDSMGSIKAEYNSTTNEIELNHSGQSVKPIRVDKANSATSAATSTRSDYMGVKTVANGSTNYTTQGTLVAEHNQTTDEIELKNSAEHAKPVRVSKSDTADSATTATRSDYMGVKIDTNNGTSYTAQGTLVAEYNSESDIIELKNSATNVKTIKVGKADYAVNAAAVPWSGVTGKPTIPSKTSQLTNDSGFLTSVAWSAVTGKPTIPSKTSQLTNDSGFLTSVAWSAVTNRPTKLSDFTNDLSFANTTTGYADLSKWLTVYNGTDYNTMGSIKADYNSSANEINLVHSGQSVKPVRVARADTADSATTATRSDYMGVKIATNNGTSYTAQGTLVAEYDSTSGEIELKNSATSVKTVKVAKATYAVNAASVPWSGITNKPTIPTKTSQLTNDSSFLTTSSTIPWSRITSAPTIPTKTSQLTNDSGFLTSVAWSAVTGKPTIPTKTSQLTNDSGYITGVSWSDVSGRPTNLSQFTNGPGYLTQIPVANLKNILSNSASGYFPMNTFDQNSEFKNGCYLQTRNSDGTWNGTSNRVYAEWRPSKSDIRIKSATQSAVPVSVDNSDNADYATLAKACETMRALPTIDGDYVYIKPYYDPIKEKYGFLCKNQNNELLPSSMDIDADYAENANVATEIQRNSASCWTQYWSGWDAVKLTTYEKATTGSWNHVNSLANYSQYIVQDGNARLSPYWDATNSKIYLWGQRKNNGTWGQVTVRVDECGTAESATTATTASSADKATEIQKNNASLWTDWNSTDDCVDYYSYQNSGGSWAISGGRSTYAKKLYYGDERITPYYDSTTGRIGINANHRTNGTWAWVPSYTDKSGESEYLITTDNNKFSPYWDGTNNKIYLWGRHLVNGSWEQKTVRVDECGTAETAATATSADKASEIVKNHGSFWTNWNSTAKVVDCFSYENTSGSWNNVPNRVDTASYLYQYSSSGTGGAKIGTTVNDAMDVVIYGRNTSGSLGPNSTTVPRRVIVEELSYPHVREMLGTVDSLSNGYGGGATWSGISYNESSSCVLQITASSDSHDAQPYVGYVNLRKQTGTGEVEYAVTPAFATDDSKLHFTAYVKYNKANQTFSVKILIWNTTGTTQSNISYRAEATLMR